MNGEVMRKVTVDERDGYYNLCVKTGNIYDFKGNKIGSSNEKVLQEIRNKEDIAD